MKKHIISFVHQPKKVIVVSLVIAIIVGTLGYLYINKKPKDLVDQNINSNVTKNQSLGYAVSGKVQDVLVKVGDQVKKGQVLATLIPDNMDGSLTQAESAYAIAKANYEKVINGATGPTIDVAKTAVATAQANLNEVKKQQDTLVVNARRKLYSDNLVATSDDISRRNIVPIVTGAYNGEEGGQYKIFFNTFNDLYNLNKISFSGIEQGDGTKDDLPQPLGTKGLLIAFPKADYELSDIWTINIPNKNGINYASNLNAYQSALQTRDQAVSSAEAALNQAEAALTLTVTSARPEDVAIAKAQVESAQGVLISNPAYSNTIIMAPSDGTVMSVTAAPGQSIAANIPVIELTVNGSSN